MHPKPEWLASVSPYQIQLLAAEQLDTLESRLGRPYANKSLPEEMRIREVMEWLRVEKNLERITESVWETAAARQADSLTKFLS